MMATTLLGGSLSEQILHQTPDTSFQFPVKWTHAGYSRANMLPPELRTLWYSGFRCDEANRLLYETFRHFAMMKSDWQKNYARHSDGSTLRLLFAQTLPLERYESALSYELYRYGRIILRLVESKGLLDPRRDRRDDALQAIITLFTLSDDVGLAGDRAQRAFAKSVDKLLDSYVRQHFGSLTPSNRTSLSVLPELNSAMAKEFSPFVSRLLTLFGGARPLLYSEDDDMMIPDQVVEKWQAAALDKLGQIRSTQILDILQHSRTGQGIPAPLQDLKDYLVKPAARKFMTAELVKQLYDGFLHPAASTVEVLAVYMTLVEAFREMDPSGVVIHRVSLPIRIFLKTREDAVKIIISSLLENHVDQKGVVVTSPSETFCAEIAEVMRATVPSEFSEYYESKDLTDLTWLPDPVDAAYGHRGFKLADRMAHLITLEEKEAFIKELQNVLGERLLRSDDYNFERELRLLGMFRMRFEEHHITQCEIMLRDAMESQRIDHLVTKATTSDQTPDNNEPAFHAKMISKYYWPALRDDTFLLPPFLAAKATTYGAAYRHVKSDRRLEWLPALGRVSLTLSLTDRTITEEVTTSQAAVIHRFHSPTTQSPTHTTASIAAALEMDEAVVRAALTFWIGKLVLRESTSNPDTFAVLETLPSASSTTSATNVAAAAAAAQAETAAASSTLKSAADLLADNAKVYASFVVGMLTNQGGMPTKRVLAMLKMVVPGGFPFEQEELVGFLGELANEGKIERVGILWKIVKKAA